MKTHKQKTTALMMAVLALIAITGGLFISQVAESSERSWIDWARYERELRQVYPSNAIVPFLTVEWGPEGSSLLTHFRTVYIGLSPSESIEPELWTEIPACRHYGDIRLGSQDRCTMTWPKVSEPGYLWIKVTINAVDGLGRCAKGVSPNPDTAYCGDVKILKIPVNP